jgi:tRNA(fMet)-specific endonuclease VapC
VIVYVLDTSICIELIRGRSDIILAHLRACEVGTVGMSSITFAELQYGAARSRDPRRNRAALVRLAAVVEVQPFDTRAAEVYGEVRRRLERTGSPIGAMDTLIAAHALALPATLVTSNQREFRRVEGLPLANWTQEA